ASNANFGCEFFATGGSWKKSPVTITCASVMLPILESLSNKSPSTMETAYRSIQDNI
ncbi:hypothetical protein PLICRDRAFT_113347, partial [Plicaturopsis crispa FD-325 SS-3]